MKRGNWRLFAMERLSLLMQMTFWLGISRTSKLDRSFQEMEFYSKAMASKSTNPILLDRWILLRRKHIDKMKVKNATHFWHQTPSWWREVERCLSLLLGKIATQEGWDVVSGLSIIPPCKFIWMNRHRILEQWALIPLWLFLPFSLLTYCLAFYYLRIRSQLSSPLILYLVW